MFLAEVDISKTAYFMMTQNFSQVVTKFIPCDDVTRFDGTYLIQNLNTGFVDPEKLTGRAGSAYVRFMLV